MTTKKKTGKKTPKKGPPKTKPTQSRIPGTAPAVHADIEDAAEVYREKRDSRMAYTLEETKAKEKLMHAMKRHQCTVYDYEAEGEPFRIELVEVAESVKVKKRKLEAAEEAAE